MANFKIVQFQIKNELDFHMIKINIMVNYKDRFYAFLPAEMHQSAANEFKDSEIIKKEEEKIKVKKKTYEELIKALQNTYRLFLKPQIIKEPIILYNIEVHASFAEAEDGTIHPNANYPGTEWTSVIYGREKYGSHHATNPAEGGYSLTVGAMAVNKVTYTYGEKSKIEYEPFFDSKFPKPKNHPAALLNSWTALSLPEKAKEIPYSDEAAMFFYNLMFSVCVLCQKIQDHTFDQKDLLTVITDTSKLIDFKEKKI